MKAAIPSQRLLVFSVDKGWEPLCRFLAVPVPTREFPNVNDRNEIKKMIGGIMKGAYGILALGTLFAMAFVYGAVRFLG